MVVDATVKQYRTGGCFALAEALRRLTGFPVRAIHCGSFVHAFVLSPSRLVWDIHGVMPWADFLAFLVREGAISADDVARGCVEPQPLPEAGQDIYWRHLGYRVPSERAVKDAEAVARSHPNLAAVVRFYLKAQDAYSNHQT